MFKRKPRQPDETNALPEPKPNKRLWFKLSIAANIAIMVGIVIVATGAFVIHESNTNPDFCASCHLMQSHVTSYDTSGNLDYVHQQAGVQCKDCHDYSLSDEIKAGIKFVTHDYDVDENGELLQRDFGDAICTQCHISREHVALATDFLYRNPHDSPMGVFTCNTCHLSHTGQIDYCGTCHKNNGQRMLGDTTARSEKIGVPSPEMGNTSPYGW